MKHFTCFLILAVAITVKANAVPDISNFVKIIDIPKGNDSSTRIIGGDSASISEFPWHAYIITKISLTQEVHCEGSFVSTEWVMTAAQCINFNSILKMEIRYGSSNRDTQKKVYSLRALIHTGFSPQTFANDIAFLKLTNPVTDITPIRLPSYSDINDGMSGENVIYSSFGEGQNLQSLQLTSITNNECNSYFNGIITSKILCATPPSNKAVCRGDGGSPLLHKEHDGQYTQIGISSFIKPGCETKYAAGFTRVAKYLDLIQAATNIHIRENTPTTTTTTTTPKPNHSTSIHSFSDIFFVCLILQTIFYLQ